MPNAEAEAHRRKSCVMCITFTYIRGEDTDPFLFSDQLSDCVILIPTYYSDGV